MTQLDDTNDVDDVGGTHTTGMPRWVKVFGTVVLALVLLFVVANLTGLGGDHGPGRHGDGDGDDQEQPSDDDAGHDPSDWDH